MRSHMRTMLSLYLRPMYGFCANVFNNRERRRGFGYPFEVNLLRRSLVLERKNSFSEQVRVILTISP